MFPNSTPPSHTHRHTQCREFASVGLVYMCLASRELPTYYLYAQNSVESVTDTDQETTPAAPSPTHRCREYLSHHPQ